MRSFIHVLSGLLLLLLLIAVGATLILAPYVAEHCRPQVVDAVRSYRTVGGIAVLALVVLYLGSFGRRRTGEQYLSFENVNGGAVSISMKAVSDFIAKIGDEFAAILSLKPDVRPRGGSIEVELDIKVKAGTQIPELCQLLQERVRESVRDNLGLSDIRKVKVTVRDIVGAAPARDEMRDEIQE